MDLELRAAEPADATEVSALLEANGLVPLSDRSQFGPQYILAISEGRIAAVAGMELHGDDALLRSVVVDRRYRALRLGMTLAQNRIDWARDRAIRAVYLLTTTAAPYWSRFGFTEIDRESGVPESIASSEEWSGACPASSAAMRLVL